MKKRAGMLNKKISQISSLDSTGSYKLWGAGDVPISGALHQVGGVKFRIIKRQEPEADGYTWLKGAAIASHEGQWLVSFGHNKGQENTATEVSNAVISRDNGNTWGELLSIDARHGNLATSHGVHLVNGRKLWAFMGAFYGRGRPGGNVHTRAYLADSESLRRGKPAWEFKGVVAEDGFWPLQTPLRMENGCWIMAGVSVGGGENDNTPPAVAFSKGDDLTSWEVVKISTSTRIWGESTVIVNGRNVLLVARSLSLKAEVSTSSDYGRTWAPLRPSNLPMADSKPYAGTLSTKQNYLINTICGDVHELEYKRNPLAIAVSRPGEMQFTSLYRILDSRWPIEGASGHTEWAYPYAVEHGGHLWIVFHMDRGRGAAGLAVIPLSELKSS